MKKFIMVLAISICLTLPAYAKKTCPPGQEKKGWKCVDIEDPDGGNTNTNENDNRNTNFNTNFNSNSNKNTNKNTNTNTNTNKQAQGQLQLQGQLQGQAQGQTAHNEGVEQSVTINEADIPVTYNHISPGTGKTDADLAEHGDASIIRTYISIFKHDDDGLITYEEASKASSGADVDIQAALLFEPDVRLNELDWENYPTGKYMGSITVTTDDASGDQIVAAACKEAMKRGATGAIIYTDTAKRVSGTKYGIDLGGAGSVAVTESGSAVVSPGATLGWSKAKSDNRVVTEVYMELFYDSDLTTDLKPVVKFAPREREGR
jgi:hypothetical protein